MPGAYKEITDTTVVAMFKVVKDDKSAMLFEDDTEDVRILAWTTTGLDAAFQYRPDRQPKSIISK